MFNRKKKNYAKLVAVIIAGISFFNIGVVDAATLQDIESSSNYAKEAIMALAEKDIITGDELGNFNPKNTVTRAEMITMIVRALKVDTSDIPDTPTFKDVPNTHWAYKYVEAAYREGIVKGMSEEVFGKNEKCTREQMTVMFVRSLGLSDESIDMGDKFTYINELSDKDMISSWAKDGVEFSLASGLMNGTSDTTFSPKGNAQRQQVAVVTHRVITDKDNILEYAKGNSETVKYPNLYEALTASKEYRGEFSINGLMNLYGATPEETMTFAMTGNGAINGADSQMQFNISISQADLTLPDFTFEMINVDNKLYIKESGFDTWIETEPKDMESVTPIKISPNELKQINEQFISIYNELPIEEAGTVEVDGVNATKYTLSLDNEAINELFSEEFLEQDMDLDAIFDDAQLSLVIEFYLNEQNQIIKETLAMNAKFQLDGEEISFDMSMDVSFKNIGADIVITAPNIEEITVNQEDVDLEVFDLEEIDLNEIDLEELEIIE